jgi:MraZ protein
MLLGTYLARLAENHRTAIPSQLKKELGTNVVIAKWYEGCLVLVDKTTLEALLTRIRGEANLITEPVRGSEHFIFASAYEVEPDLQGRIVIPENLTAYAGLKDEIYFIGVGDRVELWDRVTWDEKEKQIVKDAPKFIEELANKNGRT